ncbi:MAG: hypothetical protein QXL86_01345 [Candidatus Aenigmatarchaeota archaeon]
MKVFGQSSFELLLTFMIGMAIITPIVLYIIYVQNNYSDSYKVNAAQNVVNKLAEAADSIYLQGPGSKIVLTLYFPQGIEETAVSDKMISIKLSIGPGITEVYQMTKEPVEGSLPTTSGTQRIVVENVGDRVKIYKKM